RLWHSAASRARGPWFRECALAQLVGRCGGLAGTLPWNPLRRRLAFVGGAVPPPSSARVARRPADPGRAHTPGLQQVFVVRRRLPTAQAGQQPRHMSGSDLKHPLARFPLSEGYLKLCSTLTTNE